MRTKDELVTYLLDEMDEYWDPFEHFPLYQLSWALSDEPLSREEKHRIARETLDLFRQDHPSRVVWSPWPIDLKGTRELDPAIEITFELDPEGDPSEGLLVLVPDL